MTDLMGTESLDKAEENPAIRLAHVLRNDLLVAHGILLQATKLLVDAQHRLNGTMQSLVEIEEKHGTETRPK